MSRSIRRIRARRTEDVRPPEVDVRAQSGRPTVQVERPSESTRGEPRGQRHPPTEAPCSRPAQRSSESSSEHSLPPWSSSAGRARGFSVARSERERLLADAQREAEAAPARGTGRTRASRRSRSVPRSSARFRIGESRSRKIEERVLQKELEVEGRLLELERRDQGLGDREVHIKALQEELRDAHKDALGALEKVSGLTVHEARQQLLERSKDLVRHELARDVRQMEEEARSDARRRARALVADSLQRVAAEPHGRGHRDGRRARIGRSRRAASSVARVGTSARSST